MALGAWETKISPADPSLQLRPEKDSIPKSQVRRGLFIHVADGKVAGQQADLQLVEANVPISTSAPLNGPEVKVRFEQMFRDAGLTGPEAAGLVACWTTQFFEKTDGGSCSSCRRPITTRCAR